MSAQDNMPTDVATALQRMRIGDFPCVRQYFPQETAVLDNLVYAGTTQAASGAKGATASGEEVGGTSADDTHPSEYRLGTSLFPARLSLRLAHIQPPLTLGFGFATSPFLALTPAGLLFWSCISPSRRSLKTPIHWLRTLLSVLPTSSTAQPATSRVCSLPLLPFCRAAALVHLSSCIKRWIAKARTRVQTGLLPLIMVPLLVQPRSRAMRRSLSSIARLSLWPELSPTSEWWEIIQEYLV